MLSGMKLDPEITESSHEMRYVFGQGRSMAPHQSVGSDKGFQFQDKSKWRHSLGQPYLAPTCELRQPANTGQATHLNSSESDQKLELGDKSSDGDELVKHMSNLPGFLQQMDKEKSVQEKALNFGVLDWKRLETWKYTERIPGRYPKKTSFASEPPKMGPILKKHPLSSGNQSWTHVSQFNSPQRQPPPPHSSHLKHARHVGYHKEENFVRPVKFKGNETCNQESQAAKLSTVCRQEDRFYERVQLCKRSCSKTNVDYSRWMDQRKEASLTEQSKHKFSLVPPIKAVGKRSELRYADEMKCTTECCLPEPPTIGFLPKHFSKNGYSQSSQSMESRASLEGQLTDMAGNALFSFFSIDVPHSCPLPSAATSHAMHIAEPAHVVTSDAVNVDIWSSAWSNANSASSKISGGKCSMIREKAVKPSAVREVSKKINANIAEQPIVKGRAPSPTRRFSFSLGRLSRSGSFKESSAVPPQLSSTHTNVKSGQVRPEVLSNTDNFERDKESASGKRHSSPLRRLLSPLLKYKGAQSADTIGPSNGSLRTMTARTTSTKWPSHDRKPEASFIQALLQLTMKNELPFFKLVVDNCENMLAAAVKRLPTSGKNDLCMIYTFYSVHEIRKKGMNWISQGSKSKSCSLGYNTIGQMKISTPHHSKVKAGDCGGCDTECVLYGVDPGQINKQTLEFVPNKEIAAIIVKKPKSGELSNANANQLYKGTKFPHNVSLEQSGTEENKISKSMVVIFPGGVHSTPIKGTPSSLISRWKSGGACDCGGWDVGCKLRILADNKSSSSILQASVCSSNINRISLFDEGDEPKSKPVFSLEPLRNGLYSVDLDASITLVEAFATCVAYVTCSKFPEMVDIEVQSDSGRFPDSILRTDTMAAPFTFQSQLPVKYATCPPLSPAGRI